MDVVARPEAGGDRVAASKVSAELVTALDDWAILEHRKDVQTAVIAALRRADARSEFAPFRHLEASTARIQLTGSIAKMNLARTSPGALVAIAELLHQYGLDKDAAVLLRHAMSLHPRDFLIAFRLGEQLHFVNEDREAIGAYRVARAIRPDNPTVLNNLGSALFAAGDRAGARVAFEEALRLEGQFAPAHYNLGRLLQLGGDRDGASASYREAIRFDPAFAQARTNLALILEEKGDLAGALAELREAIRIDPRSQRPGITWARCCPQRGTKRERLPNTGRRFDSTRTTRSAGTTWGLP
jgi:tetratricopeptide (TPR) repeat protein